MLSKLPKKEKKRQNNVGLMLFLQKFSIKPISLSLYELAMQHSSWTNENLKMSNGLNNERLEFLGDAVLSVVVAENLYRLKSDAQEGELTFARAKTVCEGNLAKIAREIGLPEHIMLGKGEEKTGGRSRDSILADCVESLIGAIYLDQGFMVAKAFIEELVLADLSRADGAASLKDSKSLLLEYVQDIFKDEASVEYDIVAIDGPPHCRVFTSNVCVNGKIMGNGLGKTKQESEKKAAEDALLNIDCLNASVERGQRI